MEQLKALQFVNNNLATIFLAGSIEMGAAENWCVAVENLL